MLVLEVIGLSLRKKIRRPEGTGLRSNEGEDMKIHASHPLIERYGLCGVTHEGNENFPVRVAYAGERVDCADCQEVIRDCKRFYALHDYSMLPIGDVKD